MIHFEITQSPDDNVRAPFQFFQNQIYLGKTDGNLHIQDPALLASHLMIEVIENELLVHPQRGVESYLINGKRATSIRKLKINDSITLGQTTLRIIHFQQTHTATKKETLEKKLDSIVRQGSLRLTVIESLMKKSKE